jgi:small-conductance mechanosensitive channel
MQVFGIPLLGFNSATMHQVVLSVAAIGGVLLIRYVAVWIVRLVTGESPNERVVFWTRQATALITGIVVLVALVSIWFKDPAKLATMAGLIGAGLAFALQKVVTAFAGYLVILRGKTFTVGDRITMGGVRGDVISLGFLQTRIMEMGEPPGVQSDSNKVWVRARQYTGRIVSVTNDKVFDEPIYNYTRDFPFLWEEITIPVSYQTDRRVAETILLDCAREATGDIVREAQPHRGAMEKRYFIDFGALEPRVFWQITDNWLELNLRFLVPVHGVRYVKDELARLIMERFDHAGIGIASATYDVVGFPPIRLEGPIADKITDELRTAQSRPADTAPKTTR